MVWARGIIRSEDKMLLRVGLKHDFFFVVAQQAAQMSSQRNIEGGKTVQRIKEGFDFFSLIHEWFRISN